ncbi:MAG: hypothetical protein QOD06_2514 [Candidatus Binatota bacterium]|nr:hypothetical protein [Candidatus Binatota bacterium]
MVHVYAAIVLVGSIIFNTIILIPAMRRIPPAHSAVVSDKIGFGLMTFGTSALVLLGVTGFLRLWIVGQLGTFFTAGFWGGPYGRWVGLMALSWLVLAITGALSGYWYQTVLTRKLSYSAGLRDLEEKRAAQEKVSMWQERLAYLNLTAALLAALGGAMARFY